MSGLIIAAPSSGAGKTTVTLALLRLLAARGVSCARGEIRPRLHRSALSRGRLRCALPQPRRLGDGAGSAARARRGGRAADRGRGHGSFRRSPARRARRGGRPRSGPVAAGDPGRRCRPHVGVGGAPGGGLRGTRCEGAHRRRDPQQCRIAPARGDAAPRPCAARAASAGGAAPNAVLALPARHLGLVQADERPELDAFLDSAADAMAETLDRDTLLSLAAPLPAAGPGPRIEPPAQTIAVARDAAFSFAYPHCWRTGAPRVPSCASSRLSTTSRFPRRASSICRGDIRNSTPGGSRQPGASSGRSAAPRSGPRSTVSAAVTWPSATG